MKDKKVYGALVKWKEYQTSNVMFVARDEEEAKVMIEDVLDDKEDVKIISIYDTNEVEGDGLYPSVEEVEEATALDYEEAEALANKKVLN